jgi:hypothetical protein
MGVSLSGNLLDASQVATCVALASILVFCSQYLFLTKWWREPVGWSVAGERVAFVALLTLLVAQTYWPFSLPVENDFLLAEAILLAAASVSISGGTLIMVRMRMMRPVAKPPVDAVGLVIWMARKLPKSGQRRVVNSLL